MRKATITRETKETRISCSINLDGKGDYSIQTPSGFLNHMLETFAIHSGIDLDLTVEGDIHVDYHHTIEDTGIVLGISLQKALGEKKGIHRFGAAIIPLDEALSMVAVDLGGRPYMVYDVKFSGQRTGDIQTDLWQDFFQAFSMSAGLNLHVKLFYGRSDHHKIESIFKALARALSDASALTSQNKIPSTKGVL
jgi:imidazoleglycerol-phosphate dehydratase